MTRPRPKPEFLAGMLPMLLDERPFDLDAPGWVYEIKFDGYRCLAEFGNGAAFMHSKAGADFTGRYPEVAKALAAVPSGPHVVDGELVVLDDLGRSDFDTFHAERGRKNWRPGAPPVVYAVFDVLVLAGRPVMDRPLLARKALIAPLLEGVASVLPVAYIDGDLGRVMFDKYVLGLGLEGLVAKREHSIYRPGVRSSDWVKVKRKGAVPAGRFSRKP